MLLATGISWRLNGGRGPSLTDGTKACKTQQQNAVL
jgi:hypothetical protein